MKRYIATLVLAGALLCPSFVSANAVTFPHKPNTPSMARNSWDYFLGAGMVGSYWMFVFFEL